MRGLVEDMVVLVVDEEHPRYRQLGRMLYSDWDNSGVVYVGFADGHEEEFYDGTMHGDPPAKIKVFYRHDDKAGLHYDSQCAGPASFQELFEEIGGNFQQMAEQYMALFGEDI